MYTYTLVSNLRVSFYYYFQKPSACILLFALAVSSAEAETPGKAFPRNTASFAEKLFQTVNQNIVSAQF